MRRNMLGIGAVVVLLLAAASAVAVQDLEIISDPPGGEDCICPANYDPVVCVAPDGSRAKFSNACVAGCHGYTRCAQIIISPQP